MSTLQFVKNESLTQVKLSFLIGSIVFIGPGSAFSESPDLGPGPLYKVCLDKNIGENPEIHSLVRLYQLHKNLKTCRN